MKRVFQDEGVELVEVTLLMRKQNFDALVDAYDDKQPILCNGISIHFDESHDNPIARLVVSSSPEQKEIQIERGFVGSKIVEAE